MNTRPQFDASGLSAPIAALAQQKADRQWCFLTTDGRTFYLDETRAKAMQAEHGGEVFAPKC